MKKRSWLALLAAAGSLCLALPAWWVLAMPGKSYAGPLRALDEQGEALQGRLRGHVEELAGRIGPRYARQGTGLSEAAAYLESQLTALDLKVERHTFLADNREQDNLEVVLPGTDPGTIVVGAHYDTVPGCPGADDNASALAALLELAREFRSARPRATLRLVAFANEESFRDTGSQAYARALKRSGEPVLGMLSLEMLGVFSDEENSQRYPLALLAHLYPSRANFISFVGDLRSRSLVRRCIGAFRRTALLPSEGIAAPHALRDIGRSDHYFFWAEGYPALMVTDTSNFRYPHYHEPTDTPDRLDYLRLTLVTQGLFAVVHDLIGT